MPLSESAAVDYGSEFVGEFFIYSVAIAVLTTEYYASARKAVAKEEAQQRRLASMEENIAGLQRQLAELEAAKASEAPPARSTLRAAADAAAAAASVFSRKGGSRAEPDSEQRASSATDADAPASPGPAVPA